jgi:hypothetical protein
MLGAAFAVVVLFQSHAPSDVPPNHWAHKAVEELFEAGILHGYAHDPIHLMTVAADTKWITSKIAAWRSQGLMVGYPDGLSKVPTDWNSPYEQAVAIHAVWANLCQWLNDPKRELPDRNKYLSEFDDVARAISMRADVLTKLQGEPKTMVDELIRIRSRESGATIFGG